MSLVTTGALLHKASAYEFMLYLSEKQKKKTMKILMITATVPYFLINSVLSVVSL